jgi:hypothetical protein
MSVRGVRSQEGKIGKIFEREQRDVRMKVQRKGYSK